MGVPTGPLLGSMLSWSGISKSGTAMLVSRLPEASVVTGARGERARLAFPAVVLLVELTLE